MIVQREGDYDLQIDAPLPDSEWTAMTLIYDGSVGVAEVDPLKFADEYKHNPAVYRVPRLFFEQYKAACDTLRAFDKQLRTMPQYERRRATRLVLNEKPPSTPAA